MTPPTWATCTTCQGSFAYDADFYRSHALVPPRTCRPCRARRAARVVTVPATVTAREPAFIFAIGDDKARTRYFIAPICLAPELGVLSVGDRVLLDVDPAEPVAPGRKPRALRVRRPLSGDESQNCAPRAREGVTHG